MKETRRVAGTWVVLAGLALSVLSGCGVQAPATSGTSGTSGSGGTGAASAQASIGATPVSLAFGNVALNTTATQPVAIASTGTAALQVSALTVTGSGFGLGASPTLPLNVAPGATYTINVTFTPTVAGQAAGGLSITSNASNMPAVNMGLTGAGIQRTYSVELTWQSPANNGDPVVGYNVYRAVSGSGNFAQLNGAPVAQSTYADMTASAGNWDYVVRSVDASGAVSSPSNVYTAAIP